MRLRLAILAILLITLCALPANAMKLQVKMNQQGVLTDDTGAPFNGSATIVCRVYDAENVGNLIHTEPATVQSISNGLFQLTLGDAAGAGLSPDVFASESDSGEVRRYLEMEINGETLPRVELVATPFAVAAHRMAGDVETMPGQMRIWGAQPPEPVRPMVDLHMTPTNGAIMGGYEYPPDEVKPQFNFDFDDVSARMSVQGQMNPAAGIAPCVRATADDGTGALLQLDTEASSGISPCIKIASQTNPPLGDDEEGAFLQMDGDVNGGINPCVRLASSNPAGAVMQLDVNQASGIIPCVRVVADPTSGSFLTVDVNQPSGILPCVRVAADPTTGSSFMVDVNQPSGIVPCVRASADPVAGSELRVDLNDASGISPCVRVASDPVTGSILQLDGDATGGINPCVIVGADPGTGSSLQVDYNQTSGIAPCIRVVSDATGAALNMSREFTSPSPVAASFTAFPASAANDSVSIGMTVDSNVARMELYAGAAAMNTPIVLKADAVEARVGINTSTPTVALEVVGDLCVTGSMDACSDVRYKRNIRGIDGALDMLSSVRGVEYEWRRDEFANMRFNDGTQVGVIAQEVEEVLPMLVSTRDDGYKAVDYTKLTAVLIEAVKELKAENEELRGRLDRMEDNGIATASR